MTIDELGLLEGRYELTQRIAVGGMGEIWRAHDTVLDREVAVKLLKEEYADTPEFRDRFRTEAQHAASVTHPNIANVFDYGDGEQAAAPPFLVMELVEGEPLSEQIARDAPFAPDRVWQLIGQVAGALAAAHAAGFVHRDVKPANLLICPDGTVKVTDFGIARAVDAVPSTTTGFVIGTASYMAPEQVAGERPSPATDLYALGVVAYECASGRRPFEGEPLAVALAHREKPVPPLPEAVPPALRELIMALLEKDPTRRPSNAAAIAAQARRLASDDPTGERTAVLAVAPVGQPPADPAVAGPMVGDETPTRVRRPLPARRWLPVAAVLAVLLVGGIVAATGGGGGAAHRHAGGGGTGGAAMPLRVVSASVYPPGDADDPTGASLASDGNPATAWQTEYYASPAFGNLKPGVGLLFDLGQPVHVRDVRVALLTAGASVQLWAGDSPTGLMHGQPLATQPSAAANLHVSVDTTARYWLVWFTSLPAGPSGYQDGIAEASFSG